ncbi:ABC transporter substrate-binding protein [Enterococcus alcedinis]|uniref:ABC transporter substrate-binding protein n=1 Tax=Enterococcus alcedinis TaxID=1274384 RepID=A0A917JG07_9ENTE|nr:ABC transporter substrate-binding protein [Enterococcus alcedinis]MBP2102976.1 putative aldouronate transport system substrate-binding protein [Enterococcus alcedinis]GGI66550.1 ABC transporter substrate-binding protein [Enterococcus alcedinis]
MKTRSKLLPIVLCSVFLLGACGSKGDKSASSPDYELEGISFPLEEKVTLKMISQNGPLAPKDPNEKLIFQRLEEELNVHIDWTNYNADFAEKRNLDIASGDLPDAIFNAAAGDYDLLNWAESGVIIPLEELIDQYMPNLQKVFAERPEYRTLSTAPDGHIYSLPWIEELGAGKESIHTVNDMAWINVDWLEALNLEMPTTTEELITVLEAFKTQDPNGNGEADEIPFSFINNGGNEDLKLLFGAFGEGDNDDHLVVDDAGKVQFTADKEGYKEAIKYFNQMYDKGLIDIEAFEQDWNTYVAKGKEHRYGVYFTWDKANISGMNESYDVLPVLAGPDGRKHITRTNGMGFSRDRFVITSANKNLELTARWIDKMYEPLQSVQNNWGTYGDTEQANIFELKDGSLQHLDLAGEAPGELRQKTEASGPLAILDSYYGTVTTMPDDAKWRLDLMHEYYVPYVNNENNYPRVFLEKEQTDRLSKIETDMWDYTYRKRAEWITNGKIDAEWDEYLAELDRVGLEEWLEIKQAGYDTFVKGVK